VFSIYFKATNLTIIAAVISYATSLNASQSVAAVKELDIVVV